MSAARSEGANVAVGSSSRDRGSIWAYREEGDCDGVGCNEEAFMSLVACHPRFVVGAKDMLCCGKNVADLPASPSIAAKWEPSGS